MLKNSSSLCKDKPKTSQIPLVTICKWGSKYMLRGPLSTIFSGYINPTSISAKMIVLSKFTHFYFIVTIRPRPAARELMFSDLSARKCCMKDPWWFFFLLSCWLLLTSLFLCLEVIYFEINLSRRLLHKEWTYNYVHTFSELKQTRCFLNWNDSCYVRNIFHTYWRDVWW